MQYNTKTCQRCQVVFEPNSGFQKFCHECKIGNHKEWFQKRDRERFLNNCNCGRAMNGGICPHKETISE